MRVMLDPNILVRYLLLPREPARSIVHAALVGAYSLLLPERFLDELAATTAEKIPDETGPSSTQLVEFIEDLRGVAIRTSKLTTQIRPVTRDLAANYLIACASEGDADILVSSHRDLLLLGRVGNLNFISPKDFVRFLASKS